MSDKEKVSGEEISRFTIWEDGSCSKPSKNIGEWCLYADHQRITEALRAELETERIRLAACGVVAMANTPESLARARDMHPDYMSASCQDVMRAVDTEIELRAERDQLRAEVERLNKLAESISADCNAVACERNDLRAQLAQQQVPDGYVLMPRSLTAENGAKGLLLGEFSAAIELPCPCVDDDEANEQCELCGGDGSYMQAITIDWETIKAIYAKTVEGLAAAPAPVQHVCDTCHGQGEVWTGENQTFGYMSMQPPEPIMEPCPECGGAPVQAEPASQWVAVSERLPSSRMPVLARYTNDYGHGRTIRAWWLAKFQQESEDIDNFDADYDEESDTYYDPEGWYELIDNWGDYSSVAVTEGSITHWMPMPLPPAPEVV